MAFYRRRQLACGVISSNHQKHGSSFVGNVEYSKTDKGSIIRAQVSENFADYIDEMCHRLEGDQEGDLQLDFAAIELFLMDTYQHVVGTTLKSLDTDLFNVGVDSLKAIQLRRIIQKALDLDGKQLSSNVIYEHGNFETLATYLFFFSPGGGLSQ